MSPKRTDSSPRFGMRATETYYEELLKDLPREDLAEAWRFWVGRSDGAVPTSVPELRQEVLHVFNDPDRRQEALSGLGRRFKSILDILLQAADGELEASELRVHKDLSYLSQYDLRASIELLRRRGLVFHRASRLVSRADNPVLCVPAELASAIRSDRRVQQRGVYDTFTLRGHMDRLYTGPNAKRAMPAKRVREMYKMYSSEPASVARVNRLPSGLKSLVEKVLLEFGGVLPRALFERLDTDLPHWNGVRWSKILEESLVGTVQVLDLTPYGLPACGETLVIFNEVTLAWLKRVAVPGDPDAPHSWSSLGVDLASDISRFLAFVMDGNVRFTVGGKLYKTTEKRILGELMSVPDQGPEAESVLDFVYQFSRQNGLVESTGERTLAVSHAGREWEEQDLPNKLQALFEYILGEPERGPLALHQERMRENVFRLIRRIEPGIWYDIMYLPFLARNTYLCQLDDMGFLEPAGTDHLRSATGRGDQLQRMAWNLVSWFRTRLHLLGMIDIGFDDGGHPVAMRLTRVGARLLGMLEPETDTPRIGNLVITPDFEVVLFPTDDDGRLMHDLDRFCERGKLAQVVHYSLVEASLRRALQEGMSLSRIIETLELNSRTPVPQNVIYTLKSWADQAGLLTLSSDLVIDGSNGEVVERFLLDPGVKPYVLRRMNESSIQLKGGSSPSRMRSLLRELSYLVELR